MEAKHFFMNASSLRKELEKLSRIKRIWDTDDYNKAVKRAKNMSNDSMLSWMDDASIGIGRGVEDYRKLGTIESLYEICKAVSQLQALTEELIIKHENSV